MDHPVRDRLMKPEQRRWSTRLYGAFAALLIAGASLFLAPPTWWARSGFETNPGTFERKFAADYPLCASWPAGSGTAPKLHFAQIAARTGTLNGAEEKNFAVLLPKTALVTAVYCAAAPRSGALQECSSARCTPPTSALVEDNLFTNGRGIIFSFRNKAMNPDDHAHVGFWVAWR
jgi:hypothetical protein